MDEIKLALFGIGGYAANYLHAMEQPRRPGVRLVGAVDPYAASCPLCPLYPTADALYSAQQPDVVVIGTPIQFHAGQAEEAFAHGCHVVVEKPIAADRAGAQRMFRARDAAGKLLSVGYQLCYDPAMQALKRDVDAGVLGAPLRLRALVLWPRDETYYHRGCGWAGKKRDAEGRPVFDSVLSNATAHYLMNMLYLTGGPVESLQCATFRANPIETFDTAVVTAQGHGGAELFIAVSHAISREENQDPLFEYTFERGVVRFGVPGGKGERLTAHMADGQVKDYGPIGTAHMENLWNMVDAIRQGAPLGCPGETALWQVDALEKMRALQPEATPFPSEWVRKTEGLRWVPGLAQQLRACYAARQLPQWDLRAPGL